MTGRRPVGAVDNLWLRMDRPDNLMVVDSLLWLERPVDWQRFTAVVERRMLDRFPVFRQRAVSRFGGLAGHQWEDDPDFDLSRHLPRTRLPSPGDDAALLRYVEGRMSAPLDRDHPLWEFHLIDGYRGGCAVMTRFHHAIADGVALTQVLLSLTDATATGHRRVVELAPAPPRQSGSWLGGPANAVVRETGQLLGALPKLASLAKPDALLGALGLTRKGGLVADKLVLGSNGPSIFGATTGVAKRAAWTQAYPLDGIKAIGALSGATVNDVLASAVAGALASYLEGRGEVPGDLTTMVPVNLRPAGEPLPAELGNRFALVLLKLPIGVRAPLARIAEAKRRMDAIKASPEAAMTFAMIQAIGRTNPDLARMLVNFFAGKAIGVTTNVVGPPEARYLAGERISGMLGWVPGSGRQTVGVCVLSYQRTVRIGFKVDAGVVPDPHRLVEALDIELDELLRIARAA